VGSPLPACRHDPVTTDPSGEASVSVTPTRYVRVVATLQPTQDAGSHGQGFTSPRTSPDTSTAKAASQWLSHRGRRWWLDGRCDRVCRLARMPTAPKSGWRSPGTSAAERSGQTAQIRRSSGRCELRMHRHEHRRQRGLLGIVELVALMNPSGTRRYPLNEIVRSLQ
jgi:hypothetical protein